MSEPKTMADEYTDGRPSVDVPSGSIAVVQVIVFSDMSVHVAAPPFGGHVGPEEVKEVLVAALETWGYEVTATKRADPVVMTGIDSAWVPSAIPAA